MARPLLSAKAEALSCPVISVGNILAGGVGKTELVSLIAQKYLSQGKRVTISMRGYGSPWEHHGGISKDFSEALQKKFPDEALLHLLKAPGVAVSVGAQRGRTLRKHWNELTPDLVLLDDGFQHFALKRDLDIVVHDFSVRFPIYRDSLRILQQVKVPFSFSEVPVHFQNLKWTCGKYELTGMKGSSGQWEQLPSRALVFCGIGNPARLKTSLQQYNVGIEDFKVFPDHADYDVSRVNELNDWVLAHKKLNPRLEVLTTLKDYVKLMSGLRNLLFDVKYIDLKLKITENEDFFWSQINEAMAVHSS